MQLEEFSSYEDIILTELARIRQLIVAKAEPAELNWPIQRIELILRGVKHKYQCLLENSRGANNSIPEVETTWNF